MKYRKILAIATAALMLAGNSITALAVEGLGSVEYDNSVDVTYDSITLPTLVGSAYNFTLDPSDNLHTYNPDVYTREAGENNPGIYFHSEKAGAKIEALGSTETGYKKLYTLSKAVVAADAADWKAVVTAVTADDNKTPTVTAGYYVWTPADFAEGDYVAGTTTTGKKGTFTELTAANIKTYFEISEKDAQDKYTITMKEAHLTGDVVCDGKLYKDTYTELTTAIQDNKPTTDISEYVELETVNGTTSIKTVKGIYVDKTGGGYELAATANIKFTPAEIVYQATSDKVIVVNKSTKDKVVKAVVTITNADGLTFKEADSFTSDNDASVFFKATDGTAANDAVIKKVDTAITGTYTFEVPGAVLKDTQIKYQGGINDKTGGHNYFNYEAYGTSYNSNSFWIAAKANTNAGAKDAWQAYGKAVEEAYSAENGAATPKINIVYTVTNKPTAEEAADAAATEAANAFKTTYATILAKTTENIEYADLEDVNAALTAYAALSEAAQGKITTEKALLDSLKTAAEAKAGPSAAVTTFKKSETTADIDVEFNYGSATAITGVKYSSDGETWATYTNPAKFYTIDNDNNKLTVKSTFVTGLSATRYWRVYFDDSETTYVTLTFTAD